MAKEAIISQNIDQDENDQTNEFHIDLDTLLKLAYFFKNFSRDFKNELAYYIETRL